MIFFGYFGEMDKIVRVVFKVKIFKMNEFNVEWLNREILRK